MNVGHELTFSLKMEFKTQRSFLKDLDKGCSIFEKLKGSILAIVGCLLAHFLNRGLDFWVYGSLWSALEDPERLGSALWDQTASIGCPKGRQRDPKGSPKGVQREPNTEAKINKKIHRTK